MCKPSPPVTYGHMAQSWPILGRQGEEESRSKEGGMCVVLHQILSADKGCFYRLSFDFSTPGYDSFVCRLV